jgi:hypothetical protein
MQKHSEVFDSNELTWNDFNIVDELANMNPWLKWCNGFYEQEEDTWEAIPESQVTKGLVVVILGLEEAAKAQVNEMALNEDERKKRLGGINGTFGSVACDGATSPRALLAC